MTEVTILKLKEGFLINGDIAVSSTEMMVKKVKALLGVTDKSTQKNIIPSSESTKPETKLLLHSPVAKQNITKAAVHKLLDQGISSKEIADKLGITKSGVHYHIKSYTPPIPKSDDSVVDPDVDFKPLISKYQNTNTNYDGGKLDGVE